MACRALATRNARRDLQAAQDLALAAVRYLPRHCVQGEEVSGKPTHGQSYKPEYRAWQTMRLRCTVPTNPAYADYGGRGIRVCDRWLNSVTAFIEDMGPKPSPLHELDRENNDGHYEPGNCRWATRKVNDRNRRSNRFLTFLGETKTVAEWCELLGVPSDTVSWRIKAGWDIATALTTPARPKAPNRTHRRYRAPVVEQPNEVMEVT